MNEILPQIYISMDDLYMFCFLFILSKGKVLPYMLPSTGPRADPGVQAVSLQMTFKSSPAVGDGHLSS